MWKELGYQIAVIAIGTWAGVFFGLWSLVQGCWNELKKRAISTAMLTAQG